MTTMFTPEHEWINIEDHEAAVVGITIHAQDALGEVHVEPPEVDETYCYRQAMLDFPAAKQITWLERHFIPFTDANNEQDFGNIDVFYRESDTYHLEGDWGVVEVRSAPPVLTISS